MIIFKMKNKKRGRDRKQPFLASSEDENPVEVTKRESNCPNPSPTSVFFVQKSSKLTTIFLCKIVDFMKFSQKVK